MNGRKKTRARCLPDFSADRTDRGTFITGRRFRLAYGLPASRCRHSTAACQRPISLPHSPAAHPPRPSPSRLLVRGIFALTSPRTAVDICTGRTFGCHWSSLLSLLSCAALKAAKGNLPRAYLTFAVSRRVRCHRTDSSLTYPQTIAPTLSGFRIERPHRARTLQGLLQT